MRRFALPIAISLLASYGCAASEESDPAGGGNTTPAGGAASGTGTGGTGTLPVGGSGGMITSGGTGTATAGTGTATAGTAGATGTVGTAGTGGGASVGGKCTTSAASTGTPPLIDDFDDGNADIMAVDGRMGGWYLSTDGTGTGMPAAGAILPIEGGKTGKGLHLTGAGFKTWGVSLGAAVANNLTGCYDASKFTGVTVDLKGTGSVFVTVLTAAVRDAPEGQRNHYKKQVTLTAEWTTTTVAFGEMTQPGGWGLIVPFDAKKIYGIDISPVQATAPATTDYDYWVDNLSFK
ncbi:MAG: hypothetical protein K0R38_5461 [Polyangiaceae bacterium]|jgi:hypothetical protein|nr:hypothetical protein [Polyangiaceae bacterium]